MRARFFGSQGGRRSRRIAGAAAVALLAVLPAATAQAGGPTPGDHVIAVFTGPARGIVQLSDVTGGAVRIRVTLVGAPSGRIRLVGSSAPCDTPLSPENRAFSRTFQEIKWVRTSVPALMEDEGIWFVRSVRLVKAGSSTQIACRPALAHRNAEDASVAVEAANTLVTSWSFGGGTRGLLMVGPQVDDTVRVRAVFQRNESDVYRLEGSSAPCGTPRSPEARIFSATVPSSGWINGIAETQQQLDWIQSFRVIQDGAQQGCIGTGIEVLDRVH